MNQIPRFRTRRTNPQIPVSPTTSGTRAQRGRNALIGITAAALLFSGSLFAEDLPELTDPEKQMVWEIAEALADCGGAQYAAHQIAQDAGLADIAKASQEAANGSISAAHWLLWTSEEIPVGKNAEQFAEQRAQTRKTQWLARYQSDPAATLEEINRELQRCNDDLGEIKCELVTELRRWLYQQPAPVE